MVIRFGILIFFFCLVLFLVIRSIVRGGYGGRFRVVTLSLLAVLMTLMSVGLYNTTRQSPPPTIQEDFSSHRDKVLDDMRRALEQGEPREALRLAEHYSGVQDQELERLSRQARVMELGMEIQASGNDTRKSLAAYRELVTLTDDPSHRAALHALEQIHRKEETARIKNVLKNIPESRPGLRMLGYRLLAELEPGNGFFKRQAERYRQMLQQDMRESGWTNVCPASDTRFCRYVGHEGLSSPGGSEGGGRPAEFIGEILGVVWRPRGTPVDGNGTVAPEDGHYYAIRDAGRVFLRACDQVTPRGLPGAEGAVEEGRGTGGQGIR